MLKSNTCILGAGWAGLLVANELTGNKVNNVSILEAEKLEKLGGLLKSETIEGFTFDIGGPHLLFSKNESILSEVLEILKPNYSKRIRNNYVLHNGKFIPYPFENGAYMLKPDERINIAKGIIDQMLYISENRNWKPETFLDWVNGFFGDYMAHQYLIPYNRKIWKRPLEKMAADWVFSPGRLPFPKLDDILLTVAGIFNTGYKEQAYFYYPDDGGISSLFNSLRNKVLLKGAKIIADKRVNSIKVNTNGTFYINNELIADRIISTIPLPELLISLDDGDNYKELVRRFDYNSVVIVGVALKEKTPNQTSVYVPDSRIIFHRYTWMSSLVPPKDLEGSNLIAEITLPKGEVVDLQNITKKVIEGLLMIGVVKDEASIMFTRVWFNKYGYPIYTLDHNQVRDEAFRILKQYNISSVGRWGSWHYWNTDMVYKAVKEIQVFR